ncbi:MAG: 3',5'-cyclic-AMP phosphodiesterase [Proteobacteria bacterium]|nr:3',5'-cyclic-AMP phosphodiesterase [Pseudomonadota bacterium]
MNKFELNILQITDTHIFADPAGRLGGMDTSASFLKVLDLVLNSPVNFDLVLVTGDLAAESEEGAYHWLIGQLAALNTTVACLPGNHDVATRMEPIVNTAGWQYCGDIVTTQWQVILLDSAVPGAAYGALRESELLRLERCLSAHAGMPTIVVLHHNPVPMDSRWIDTMTLRNAAAFWSVVDQHAHVRCVVWGHVHQNYDSYRNGVRLLATPSTCVQFEARSRDFALAPLAPGFRHLRLSGDGELSTHVVRLAKNHRNA